MYLQADKHGDFCAIFEWQFGGAPNDVRNVKPHRITVVVSSSVDKLVKEFLRYLYRCGNGAIPLISPETTKNDPTLEPPGGRPFWLGWSEFHSPNNFFHSSYKNVGPVYKFWIELRLKIRPFWPRRKIRTSVRPEVEIKDLDPSTFWYPKRFPIDPRNVGLPSWSNSGDIVEKHFFVYEGAAWRRCRKSEICLAVLKTPTWWLNVPKGRLEIPSASAPFRLCTLENV